MRPYAMMVGVLARAPTNMLGGLGTYLNRIARAVRPYAMGGCAGARPYTKYRAYLR